MKGTVHWGDMSTDEIIILKLNVKIAGGQDVGLSDFVNGR
jgi:hypothetical protein